MLAGLVLLGFAGGSYEIPALLTQGDAVRNHTLYLPILLLVLAGAFTKSAQVPFHFRLPAAMEAPTPVSAYLHSATMVKAGIYLLARFSPILGGTEAWFGLVSVFDAATMLIGGVLALYQTDMKRNRVYDSIIDCSCLHPCKQRSSPWRSPDVPFQGRGLGRSAR
jgi:multicomponent Na+:H+ antiporter subunit A